MVPEPVIQRVVDELDAPLPAELRSRPAAGSPRALPEARRLLLALYFSSADSGASNTKRMGSRVTMVVSSVSPACIEVAGALDDGGKCARPAARSPRELEVQSVGLHVRLRGLDVSAAACEIRGGQQLQVRLADQLVLAERPAAFECAASAVRLGRLRRAPRWASDCASCAPAARIDGR